MRESESSIKISKQTLTSSDLQDLGSWHGHIERDEDLKSNAETSIVDASSKN